MRFLITDQNFGDDAAVERALIHAAGGEVTVADCRTEDHVVEALAACDPDAVLVQFAPLGARAVAAAAAGSVRAIVRYGIGVDNIDARAAGAAGIAVGRVPDYCVAEVADHTLALLLAVERGIVELATQTAAGGWDFRAVAPVRRLDGLTAGLLGFGRIARAVARRLGPLGLQVAAFDVGLDDAAIRAEGVEPLALDELLARSDVLSVHVPLNDATRHVIDTRALARLPHGAVVLNTSRGGLIDEHALADAVSSGHLRGAGIDVLDGEPPGAEHPLRGLERVVLTPHAAWYSEAAVQELREKAVATALDLLAAPTARGAAA
jgi:D-3-phosphoglycerate dehydrogenase